MLQDFKFVPISLMTKALLKALLSVLFLLPLVASAQEPQDTTATTLVQVTVSRRFINNTLLNTPAAIGTLQPHEIQRNNLSDIATVLNTLPGVFMQSGGINTNRISIRGIGARTPYGTNKIRAFYGSIPLTSGDSETTIEDIDLEMIGKIEIIKGPFSSIYGAGLGGAILIEPKMAFENGNFARISTTHGSFGLMKNNVSYSYRTSGGSLNLSYHKLQTDGYRDNSAYDREGVTLAGDIWGNSDGHRLTYFGNYTYMKAYIPSSIDKEIFENNPRAAAFTWNAAKGYEQYNTWMAGLAHDWDIATRHQISTSIFANFKKSYEPRPFDILAQDTKGWGARMRWSGYFDVAEKLNYFNIGFEYFNDGFEGGTFANLYEDNNGKGSLQGDRLTGAEQRRSFVNAFAQLRTTLSEKWEAQAGINYNKTRFELDTTFPDEAIASQSYSYDAIIAPQVSLLYKLSQRQTLYASVSRGFSLPAIEETLTEVGTINPDIKPESGYNFEAGGKFYLAQSKLYLEVTLYRMNINDLLVARRVDDDRYVGVNAGETLHQGVEATINYHWHIPNILRIEPYLSASIGQYEFVDFVDSDVDYSGNDLTGVPANKINAGFTATDGKFYFSTDFYFVDRIPLNDANSVYSGSYTLLNAKAGHRFELFKGLSSHISAGVNNITNTRYASMVLVNATGFGGAAPRYYYPGLPANYYANVAFSYNF